MFVTDMVALNNYFFKMSRLVTGASCDAGFGR